MSVILANQLPLPGLLAAPPPRRGDVALPGELSTRIEIIQAQEHAHAPRIRELFWEYLQWANAKLNEEAHALYRSSGFHEIEPYAGSEIPKEFQAHWIFMERKVEMR